MEVLDRNLEITTTTEKPAFPVSAKVYFSVLTLLTILIIAAYNIAANNVGYMTPEQNLKSSLTTILFAFPFTSFVLALLIALLPYKRKSYKQKYIPAALFILFIMYCLIFVAIIISFIWRSL